MTIAVSQAVVPLAHLAQDATAICMFSGETAAVQHLSAQSVPKMYSLPINNRNSSTPTGTALTR